MALFLVLLAAYSFSVGLRASRGASITGDEPFYLLTTQSLIQDSDLDLRQQYDKQSYRSFFDHPGGLWKQSIPTTDGRIVSPHDPGLSVLLIPGFALAGLRGAQFELALIAALTMALVYVLVAKETGDHLIAWLATLAVALSTTAFVYSSEVYPEFPGALCIALSLLLIRRSTSVGSAAILVCLLSALAWLGIKYMPLAAIIALPFLMRSPWSSRSVFLGLTAVSAAAYIWFHYAVFEDLTPYSINTVYGGAPALSVVEQHLSLQDRFYRLWGLFIDERFGIGRWGPVLLLAPISLPLLLKRGAVGATVLALFLTQLAIATFVAITMMGWWFPGRTFVVVLPLFALPLAVLLQRFTGFVRVAATVLGLYSLAITAALTRAANNHEVTLAVDPFDMRAWLFRDIRPLFPNYTAWTAETFLLTAGWLVVGVVALALIAGHEFDLRWPRRVIRPAPSRLWRARGAHGGYD
jgi:hypothetical protein